MVCYLIFCHTYCLVIVKNRSRANGQSSSRCFVVSVRWLQNTKGSGTTTWLHISLSLMGRPSLQIFQTKLLTLGDIKFPNPTGRAFLYIFQGYSLNQEGDEFGWEFTIRSESPEHCVLDVIRGDSTVFNCLDKWSGRQTFRAWIFHVYLIGRNPPLFYADY